MSSIKVTIVKLFLTAPCKQLIVQAWDLSSYMSPNGFTRTVVWWRFCFLESTFISLSLFSFLSIWNGELRQTWVSSKRANQCFLSLYKLSCAVIALELLHHLTQLAGPLVPNWPCSIRLSFPCWLKPSLSGWNYVHLHTALWGHHPQWNPIASLHRDVLLSHKTCFYPRLHFWQAEVLTNHVWSHWAIADLNSWEVTAINQYLSLDSKRKQKSYTET